MPLKSITGNYEFLENDVIKAFGKRGWKREGENEIFLDA